MRKIKLAEEIYPSFKQKESEILSLFYQKDFSKINELTKVLMDDLQKKIKVAFKKKDELLVNSLFIFQYYFSFMQDISNFFICLKTSEFEHSWSKLQDAQSKLNDLYRLLDNINFLHLDELDSYLDDIEALFPYTVFNSIEAVAKEKTCSICSNNIMSDKCSHIPGELYWGKIAFVEVKIDKFLGMSLVENPANKRCVIKINHDKNSPSNGPFGMIFSFSQNAIPFYKFEILYRKRIMKRNEFMKLNRDQLCPCGSGKKLKDCCIRKRVTVASEKYVNIVNEKIIK